MKCHVDAIQWGGGSSRIFRDLKNPMRFSGGGVVAEILGDLEKPVRLRFSGGGGGSSRNVS